MHLSRLTCKGVVVPGFMTAQTSRSVLHDTATIPTARPVAHRRHKQILHVTPTLAASYLLGFSMYSLFPWKTQYWASICFQVNPVAQAPSSTHSQLGAAMSRMWVSASRLWLPTLFVWIPDETSRNLLRMHAAWPSLPRGELPATVTCSQHRI